MNNAERVGVYRLGYADGERAALESVADAAEQMATKYEALGHPEAAAVVRELVGGIKDVLRGPAEANEAP